VADTQRLNAQFFDLGRLRVVARDRERVRLRGGFGPAAPEFDEYPWEFEAPRRYRSVRVFRRGVLRRLEVECTLAPDATGTRVDYLAWVEAIGGPVGSVVRRIVRRRVRRALVAVETLLRQTAATGSLPWPIANPDADVVRARSAPLVAALTAAEPDDGPVLQCLVATVAEAPEAEVARLRPYPLAAAWGMDRRRVLAALLRATHGGLLRLSWDLLCPSCGLPPTSAPRLADLPARAHCEACDVDVTTRFEESVEATFAPAPAVRSAERALFCHGSPMHTPRWIAQLVVEPGATAELAPALGAGRYRLQTAGSDRRAVLDVREDGAAALEARIVGDGERPGVEPAAATLRAGAVTLRIANADGRAHRVQLVHRPFESEAATATDVAALGVFRELFAADVLAPDQHVGVGRTTILFTDLVGSTALYERVGDAVAYGLVRRHFEILSAAVTREGGTVVKTIGDCVMAVFPRPLDGVRAGRAAIEALAGLTDRAGVPAALALKVGLHVGPCLAIEANGRFDYFGRTVNLAARVEAQAGPNELLMTAAIADDAEVAGWLAAAHEAGLGSRADRVAVRGVAEPLAVVRLAVPVRPA
jgi:class 3 adenylate cyclase